MDTGVRDAEHRGGGVTRRLVQGPDAVALTADPTMVFDTTTGMLWFDANGNGAGNLTLVATLIGVTSIAQSDFFFI